MELIKTKELFYQVKEKPLKVIVDNMILDSKDYFSLSSDKNEVVGIKPIEPLSKRLFVRNEVVFNSAFQLAQWIDQDLDTSKSYTNDRHNQCYIFIGDDRIIREDNRLAPPLFYRHQKINDLFDYESNNAKTIIDSLKKKGFSPSIAVSNGYDYNDSLVYYALLELKIGQFQYGYLTISKYTLKGVTNYKLLKCSPEEHQRLVLNDLKINALDKFMNAFSEFALKYKKLESIEVTGNELKAIAFDIYNKNRNVQAIQSDTRLYREIRKFKDLVNDFFTDEHCNLSYILNFIIRNQLIDFSKSTLKDNVVIEALQEKFAYKNVKRLYEGKNSKLEELRKYIDSQVIAYKKLPI